MFKNLRRQMPYLTRRNLNLVRARLSGIRNVVDYEFRSRQPSGALPNYWVLGSGRSGTTALRKSLVFNYETIIGPELPIMRPLINRLQRHQPAHAEAALEIIRSVFHDYPKVAQDWSRAEYLAEFEHSFLQHGDTSLQGTMGLLYECYLDWALDGASFGGIVGDKTPVNTFNIELIDRIAPQSRYVVVIRDPESVLRSYEKAKLFTAQGILGARQYLSDTYKVLLRLIRGGVLNTGNTILVDYDELLGDSSHVLGEIAEFIGIMTRSRPLEPDGIDAEPLLRLFSDLDRPHHSSARKASSIVRPLTQNVSDSRTRAGRRISSLYNELRESKKVARTW